MEIPLTKKKCNSMALILCAVLFTLTTSGHLEIIDTEYSVRTAIAIVEQGSLLIDSVDPLVLNIAPNIEGTDKIYSQYGLGLVVIFLPFVVLGKLTAFLLGSEQRIFIDFFLSFYNVPFAILGLYFFRSVILSLGAGTARATGIMIILAIATAYWKYTGTDFSEITQAAFLLGAVNSLVSNKERKWQTVSFWLSLLVCLKLAYVVILPIFALYLVYEERNSLSKTNVKKLIDFCVVLVPTGVVLALVNHVRFGNIFESGYGSQGSDFSLSYFYRDWFDYLFSSQRGIIPFNPILFAAIPAWFIVPKQHRPFFIFLASVILSWYLLMCFWKSFQGGYCWGNRLLVPILPLLLIPLTFINLKNAFARNALIISAFISTILQLISATTKTHECAVLRSQITELTGFHTPSQLPSTIRIFSHKIFHNSPIYQVSTLGGKSDLVIDMSSYESFHGLNLWLVHLFNFLNLSEYTHPVSLILLVTIVVILCHLLYKNVWVIK